MYSLGIGKTIFNSGISIIPDVDYHQAQIILTERLDRKKNSGAWPLLALKKVKDLEIKSAIQNRDVQTVATFEDYLDARYPFKETVKLNGLTSFLDNGCVTLNHHLAHAYSASVFSPFAECLILVIDGAGSLHPQGYEYLTLFKFHNQNFEVLDKKWTTFNDQGYSESIGLFYEAISEFIFNSKTLAGKVMGLAPLGKSMGKISSFSEFLANLDWSKSFKGGSKVDWENSPHQEFYQDLAATAQENFESYLLSYLEEVAERFPQANLIITGGCALNCTLNGKLWKSGLFKNIYLPPNPGDEGISLGCAWSLLKDQVEWSPLENNKQTSARGSFEHYSEEEIHSLFNEFQVTGFDNETVATLLNQNQMIAWFQGRSEVGPRALGHRSILALPRKGIKNYINEHIKFREAFRPYGCSVPQDEVSTYFEVETYFENPFMSFAIPIREEFREKLSDVGHIDHTSRFQTLHREQNPRYYDLLKKVGELSGISILLNTSLNVMGEPILETGEDALRFFKDSAIKHMVFNEYFISKRSL